MHDISNAVLTRYERIGRTKTVCAYIRLSAQKKPSQNDRTENQEPGADPHKKRAVETALLMPY